MAYSQACRAALLLGLLASAAAARPVASTPAVEIVSAELTKTHAVVNDSSEGPQTSITIVSNDKKEVPLPFAVCEACIQFAVEGINIVANVILNKDIEEACGVICSEIEDPRVQKACDYICDAAGVAAFIEAIEHSDLDPIYYCEILDISGLEVCPIQDCPASDAVCVKETTDLVVDPASGPKGSPFTFSMGINVTAPIGTGELALSTCNVDGNCEGIGGQIFGGLSVGSQTIQGSFTAGGKDSMGDAIFQIGKNVISLEICEGLCDPHGDGSPNPHPHAKSFGKKSFTVDLTHWQGPGPSPGPGSGPSPGGGPGQSPGFGPMPGPESSPEQM